MTFIDRIIFLLLVLFVVLSPLPFGSNFPLMWSLGSLFTATLLFLWGVQAALKPDAINVSFKRTATISLPFLLCLIWALAQAIVPAAWMGLPASPIWANVAKLTGVEARDIISINPSQTIEGAMRLVMYASVFWLSLQYTRYHKNGRYILQAILLASFIYALYGMLMHFSGTEKVLMRDKSYGIGSVTATFINRNSYATYVGLSIVAGFALMSRGFFRQSSTKKGFFLKFMIFLSTKGLFYLQCIVVLILALVLSNSRAGMLSAAAALLAFFLILPFSPGLRKSRKFAMTIIAILIALLAYAFTHFVNDQTLYRFSRLDADMQFRMQIYQETLLLIKANPLTGVGLGNFEKGFLPYQNTLMSGEIKLLSRVDKAHNTYLENASELGLPGFGMLLLSFVSMFILCFKGVFTRKTNFVFPAAGIAATVLIAIHSAFDFSVQIPAVAITYFAIMGVCVAECQSSQEGSGNAPV